MKAIAALVDQRGTPFTLRGLRGEPVVLAFVATRCSDACPIADAMFAQLARRGVRAQFVTITLDPSYDTPFVMSASYEHSAPMHSDGGLRQGRRKPLRSCSPSSA